ncbi:MAG: GDP-mannose 4,6-dehydratase, partial [Candidatus Omnitrophica bacterium]|nr:GDP-mannose 4,6-dehydratase [Candidatus Omnitrophota bacterium]
MKTILITGGAGFIGSNFIRYMLKTHSGYKVINLDNLSYAGNRDNLKDIEDNSDYKNRYEFKKGDICDSEIVDKLVSQCQAVINFAAESHVDRSILDPECFT